MAVTNGLNCVTMAKKILMFQDGRLRQEVIPFRKNIRCRLGQLFRQVSICLPGTFSSSFQNGGSATDGIRLVNAGGAVIDTVLYDSPNNNGLLDDLGSIAGPFAPDPSEGNTLARAVDCSDITNDSSEFVETSDPSPGSENIVGSSGGGDSCENMIFTDSDQQSVQSGWF